MTDWYKEMKNYGSPKEDDLSSVDWYQEMKTKGTSVADQAEAQYGGYPKTDLSFVGKAVEGLTNPKKEHDYPEIYDVIDTPSFKLAAGLLAASTPGQEKDIVLANIPGSKVYPDAYGNDILEMPDGQKAYINKPGISRRDISKVAAQGLSFLGAGRGLGAITEKTVGTGILGKALSGAAQGGVQAGLDETAQAMGSEEGATLGRTAVAAGGGILGETLLSPVSSAARNAVASRTAPLSRQEVTQVLKANGVDDATILSFSDDVLDDLATRLKTAADPQTAALLSQAKTLPYPVPLRQGQLSGNPSQQLFEDAAQKGVYGESARTMMNASDAASQQALRQNMTDGIPRLLSGGQRLTGAIGEGGERVSGALNAASDTAWKGIDEAYKVAKATKAGIGPDESTNLLLSVTRGLDDWAMNTKNLPAVVKDSVGQLRGLTRNGADLAQLEGWLQKLNGQINAYSNAAGPEYAALMKIKSSFKSTLDDIHTRGAIQGDPAAKEAWDRAISLRKQYGDKFEAGDLVQQLVDVSKKRRGELKVAAEDAGDVLFGRGLDLGKKDLYRDLLKMKSLLGSDDWNALREEVFLRLAKKAEGATVGGERQVSGVNFQKALQDIAKNDPKVLNILFNQQEQGTLRQLGQVAAVATNTAKNTSNTAISAANMLQRVMAMPFVQEKAKVLIMSLPGWKYVYGTGRAATSASGRVAQKAIPLGYAGGAAAGLTSAISSEQNRQRVLRSREDQDY